MDTKNVQLLASHHSCTASRQKHRFGSYDSGLQRERGRYHFEAAVQSRQGLLHLVILDSAAACDAMNAKLACYLARLASMMTL